MLPNKVVTFTPRRASPTRTWSLLYLKNWFIAFAASDWCLSQSFTRARQQSKLPEHQLTPDIKSGSQNYVLRMRSVGFHATSLISFQKSTVNNP